MAEHVFLDFPASGGVSTAPCVINGVLYTSGTYSEMRALSINYGAEILDVTGANDATRTHAVGLRTCTLAGDFLRAVTSADAGWLSHDNMSGAGGSAPTDSTGGWIVFRPQTPSVTTGTTRVYCGESVIEEMSVIDNTVGEAESWALTVQGNTIGLGWLALDQTTAGGATVNGTSFQMGAVSADQRVMLVTAIGSSNASGTDFYLELESDDDDTWTAGNTTRITTSTFTGAGTYSSVSYLDGPISDTYWRANIVYASGTGTLLVVAAAAIIPAA